MKFKELFPKIFQGKKNEEEAKKKKLIKGLTIFFICFILAILIASPVVAYEILYKDKIYQGVYIDSVNVGGLNQNEAIDKVNKHLDNLKQNGLNFYFQANRVKIDFDTISPVDPDLSYQILNFEANQMVVSAFQVGRQGTWFNKFGRQLSALLNQPKLELVYTLKDSDLAEILKENFNKFENLGQDAQIVFQPDGAYVIEPERAGYAIDYGSAIANLKKQINLISINSIELETVSTVPSVTQQEAEKIRPKVDEILKQEKLVITSKNKKWEILRAEFKNWLNFKKENNEIKLGFKEELIAQKLQSIAAEINVPPQDAKFTLTDGKVTEFVPSLPGLEVDQEQSQIKIEKEFLANKIEGVEMVIKEAQPKVKIGDINNFGIKELIGEGVSDFSGSHTNRIKNIKNAVAHLNGIIIPPGEFSTTDAVGPVNAETGYFQEYVIKGDRTIPEYGGGLCQIGTTMFRAALYSGLPITERRPHSYIVSYYKPLGMDATIYGPHPDLRFNNDTGNNILLLIKIDGTQLTFQFWGTSDGRKVEITDPVLYNWTAQPADRLIENPALKPGAKKLMETGRRGADAHFYRYITRPGAEKAEEIFRSHYVAWPNIYEVGITPAPEPPAAPTEDTGNTTAPSGTTGAQ